MDTMRVYKDSFTEAFAVEEGVLRELKYQDIEEWDSVGHMSLIAILEDAFDIMMEIDDIIDFNSFQKGIEIMAKYGVDVKQL